jgi:hypothetical protein
MNDRGPSRPCLHGAPAGLFTFLSPPRLDATSLPPRAYDDVKVAKPGFALSRLIVGVALASIGGCGSDADTQGSGGRGEPLMYVEGEVARSPGSPAVLEIALLWQLHPDAQGCERIADAITRGVTWGPVPGSFSHLVTRPPPDSAFAFGSNVAEAYLVALDASNHVRGTAANVDSVVYRVFYARREVPAGSPDSARYGGTGLRAGYQFGIWDLTTPAPSGSGVLRLAPPGERVRIDIVQSTAPPLQDVCSTGMPGTPPPR